MSISKYKYILTIILTFFSAFLFAYLFFLYNNGSGQKNKDIDMPTITIVSDDSLKKFLSFVEKEDFAKISENGKKVFTEYAQIPNHKVILAPFALESHPPYSIYMFFAGMQDDAVARVLLTLDTNTGNVISFLAEESKLTD